MAALMQSCSAFTTSYDTKTQQVRYASTTVEASIEESDNIEFPPPLSAVDRLKRAATFYSTAIPIVANYYGLIGGIKLQELLGEAQTEEEIEVSGWEYPHLSPGESSC